MENLKNIFSKSVLTVMAISMVVIPMAIPNSVHAIPVEDILLETQKTKETVEEAVQKPLGVAIIQILVNLISFVANRLAYDAAIAIASGGKGQSSNIEHRSVDEYFEDLGNDILGESIGQLSEGLDVIGIDFDVCAPVAPELKLDLQLGIASGATAQGGNREPKCDFREIQGNWEGFVNSFADQANGNQDLLRNFSSQFAPGQSDLSASVEIFAKTYERATKKQATGVDELLANDRFKDVSGTISGQVETPSSTLQTQFDEKLSSGQNTQGEALEGALFGNEGALLQVGISAGSVFLNTLLSELTSSIYDGLFEPPTSGGVFDPNFIDIAGRARARETYKSLLTTPIQQIEDYNIVNSFVTCPGANNRSADNCVIDTSFAAAIARAGSGAAMTIQEAIDANLLHGDWPLIPPTDQAKNQDAFCYSYGYCHGNLVKLRVARVLPVGVEMAAGSIHNSEASPVTLQEVINGYNDCNFDNPNNIVDNNHPWCRLIDPNWVIKYPATQCRASVAGQTLIAKGSDIRGETCVDTPSCIEEDDQGNCTGGYGYCTRERNTWRFGGDTCPAQFASCTTLTSRLGEQDSFLTNTVDFGQCNASNAGCNWYKADKTFSELGTPDPTDDRFVFANGACDSLSPSPGEACISDADCGAGSCDINYDDFAYGTCGIAASNAGAVCLTHGDCSGDLCEYPFNQNFGVSATKQLAASEMLYLDAEAPVCDPADDGCTEVVFASSSSLNLIRNGSFEDNTGDVFGEVVDFWDEDGTTPVEYDDVASNALFGNGSIVFGSSGYGELTTNYDITIPAGENVAFSFYAKEMPSSSNAYVNWYTEQDDSFPLFSSIFGNCKTAANGVSSQGIVLSESWKRFTCLYSQHESDQSITLNINGRDARVDGIMIELSNSVSEFHDGYSGDVESTHIRVAPDYLGCTGEATDPEQCGDFAPMCRVTENGCSAYTPTNGNPTVPGIINETDICPQECVGYETYRQLENNFETDVFPLYFIADTARTCSAQFEGCSEFTNLDSIEEGGEQREYFSGLRVCQEVLEANATNGVQATYYTWEGTEADGFQLRTWSLKRSNQTAAPCTSYRASDGACIDPVVYSAPPECANHDDIITNPDCREFYDSAGDVHYRLWSETVTVNDFCNAYRKTVSTNADCTSSGGDWDVDLSICTYNILPSESTTCPAVQNGCRGYAGNAGNNTRIAYQEFFEGGSLNDWISLPSSGSMTYSNESVARDGHSMNLQDIEVSPFALSATSCSPAAGDDTCTLTDPLSGLSCEVPESTGLVACGDVVGQFRAGLSYSVSFWARGTGTLEVVVGDEVTTVYSGASFGTVTLSPAWQEFTLGPLDILLEDPTTDLSTATMFFITGNSTNAFVDNITLREFEDTVFRIQNSWATPSTCDQTEAGIPAPQLHLGCQKYADQDGGNHNLKSFSSICREEAIGCKAVYDTQNSDSPYPSKHNAVCYLPGYSSSATPATGLTPCLDNNIEVCTVSPGRFSCEFSTQGVHSNGNGKDVSSTQAVPGDEKKYIVDLAQYRCAEQAQGCQVVGDPEFDSLTFGQNQFDLLDRHRAIPTGYASTAIINDPDTYDTTLCGEPELFCEAWSTTDNNLYYFRDPTDATCEYKTSVLLSNTRYSGWFKKGTETPCYSNYLSDGTSYGIWRNGDPGYAGYAGTCPQEMNLCSEFLDVSDTQAGSFPDGRTYNFLKNDKISEEGKSADQKCEGLISQSDGCVGFDDTTIPYHTFNASASYVRSIHADEFDNLPQFSSVSPVSCLNPDSGDGDFILQNGTTVNLCQRRCAYRTAVGGTLENPDYITDVGDSCLVSSDCPLVIDFLGNEVSGTCVNVLADVSEEPSTPNDRVCRGGEFDGAACDVDAECAGEACQPVVSTERNLNNDSNTVMKVQRDRTCAEWLACDSEFTTWSVDRGQYINVCESVALCNEYTNAGDTSFCSSWIDRPTEILDSELYANRDATWYGLDYSGYSVPGQYSVEHYNQINLNPNKWCTNDNAHVSDPYAIINDSNSPTEFDAINGTWSNGLPVACSVVDDCNDEFGPGHLCDDAPPDFRLAVGIGPCLEEAINGEFCTVGVCEDTGAACSEDTDCAPVGVDCLLITSQTKLGACYNGTCLQSIGGDRLIPSLAEQNECRGYPQENAPFPEEVVDEWIDSLTPNNNSAVDRDDLIESVPLRRRAGFDRANICANGEICECSYKEIQYGDGARELFTGIDSSNAPGSICNGGLYDGVNCGSLATNLCSDNGGTCIYKTTEARNIGWQGYCIQRDGSITILSDPDKNACLLWLPVDQLFGSTDIYNKFTSAGFPIQNTAYCTETSLFVDVYPSPSAVVDGDVNEIIPACAETYEAYQTNPFDIPTELWSGNFFGALITAIVDTATGGASNYPATHNNYGLGTADSGAVNDGCVEGNWDACWNGVSCPKNHFAIVAGCNNDGLCLGESPGNDTPDCPYFCVPIGARATSGGGPFAIGEVCDPPAGTPYAPINSFYTASDNSSDTVAGRFSVSTWTGAFTDSNEQTQTGYLVESISSYKEDYKSCVLQGVPFTPIDIADPTSFQPFYDNYYLPLNPTIGPLFYNFENNSAVYYLGCSEFGFTSVEPGYGDSPIDFGNAAFTNRTLTPNGDNEYELGPISNPLGYTTSTTPEHVGRIVQVLDFVEGFDGPFGDLRLNNSELVDEAPVMVAACEELSVVSVKNDLNACSTPYPSWAEGSARSYSDYEITLPPSIVPQDVCNSGDECVASSGPQCANGNGGRVGPPYTPANEKQVCWIGCDATSLNWHNNNTGTYANGDDLCVAMTGSTSTCIDSTVPDTFGCQDGALAEGCDLRPTKICSKYYGMPGSPNAAGDNHSDAQTWYTTACNGAVNDGNLPALHVTPSGDTVNWTNYARRASVCIGSPAGNAMCQNSYDCASGQPQVLCNVLEGESTGVCAVEIGGFADSTPTIPAAFSVPDREDAFDYLHQFFARFYSFWQYKEPDLDISGIADDNNPPEETGYYEKETTSSRHVPDDVDGIVDADISPDGDGYGSGANDGNPTAPIIKSLGQCIDDNCIEGPSDSLSVNGNPGATFQTEGNFRADLRFFATTDQNQFPLRKVLVDWGDGTDVTAASNSNALSNELWGRSSLYAAPNNYYKAHRGLKASGTPWCTDDPTETEWGLTSLSCDSAPFSYQHHYRCTPILQSFVEGRTCILTPEGNLQNSPCTGGPVGGAGGACVFQPRVFVQDNWGYCTGTCDANNDGVDTECYGDGNGGECLYSDYPLPAATGASGFLNYPDPWVYYDGYIILEP